MLNILKERMLDGMEIVKAKEKPSKYEITFSIKGVEVKTEIPKACTPGMQNRIVDDTIFNAMAQSAFKRGDFEDVGKWLDKIGGRS